MVENLVAVIMAGGVGSRFWPVSTPQKPKQFLNLLGERTLLQESLARLEGLVPLERVLVLTNEEFLDLARQQLPQLESHQFIGEPCRRDTAGAVALASLLVQKIWGEKAIMAILAADHHITTASEFQLALRSAALGANRYQAIYTLGIKPTYPATTYGYLERGQPLPAPLTPGPAHFKLRRFCEKPPLPQAQEFLASGDYFWNSGMFITGVRTILDEYRRQSPRHLEILQPLLSRYATPAWRESLAQAFPQLPTIAVDRAIMEGAERICMVEANFQWADLGGWLGVAPFLDHDDQQNAFHGQMTAYQSSGNIIFNADPQEHITLVGAQNMAVIHTPGQTLILPLSQLDSAFFKCGIRN